MDLSLSRRLKDFDSVWQRVQKSRDSTESKPPAKLMPRWEKKGCALRYAPYIK